MNQRRTVRTPIGVLHAGSIALALVCAATTPAAAAQELHVLAAGAVTQAVTRLADTFTRATGERVTLTFAQAGKVRRALDAGTPADVVVLSAPLMTATERARGVLPGSAVPLGSTGVAVGVRAGAPLPDIATPESFRRTLLAARSITYADPAYASSGAYVAKLIRRLGIAGAMAPKTILVKSGYGAELVRRGRAQLVVQNLSEIVPVKGVRVVGPLPPPL
ncbi:MAG TPA: substrate-binding domain-containing protein, partial [Candidatus Acidoferrum sp.]|nr:substrate-binding domain-containing protein [Candidatus Acidoferrum sp.]